MPRLTSLMLLLASIPTPANADDFSAVRILVVADGKPAAGARVWACESNDAVEPKPAVADAEGKVNIRGSKSAQQVFARDDSGRIGQVWISPRREEIEGAMGTKLLLVETKECLGRLTGQDGKPVVGAIVAPTAYFQERKGGRSEQAELPASIELPGWEQKRLEQSTDAEGRFKVAAPVGYAFFFRVEAKGFGESRWSVPSGIAPDAQLFVPGSVEIAADGVQPGHIKGAKIRLTPQAVLDVQPGVRPMRHYSASFDAAGRAIVSNVAPGEYTLMVANGPGVPGVFEPGQPFKVASGRVAGVTAKFGPAARLSGRIVDTSGKGIAGAKVFVYVTDGVSPQPKKQMTIETDRDGAFEAYGAAGWYAFALTEIPDGYALPPPVGPRHGVVEPVKMDLGKSHTFAPFALLDAVLASGEVTWLRVERWCRAAMTD